MSCRILSMIFLILCCICSSGSYSWSLLISFQLVCGFFLAFCHCYSRLCVSLFNFHTGPYLWPLLLTYRLEYYGPLIIWFVLVIVFRPTISSSSCHASRFFCCANFFSLILVICVSQFHTGPYSWSLLLSYRLENRRPLINDFVIVMCVVLPTIIYWLYCSVYRKLVPNNGRSFVA